ncbi:MAG: site-specific integrase [Pyrinomonadaceae bacterium]|nr:site-specific integrase [Pyrinomonadaceae bacterium]
MSVYQRNGHWHLSVTINGRRFRKAIKEARTRRQAEQAERVLRDEIFEGRYGNGGQKFFADFVERSYKPFAKEHKKGYEVEVSVLRVLVEKFGNKRLYEIKPEEIENFKRLRASEITKRGVKRSKATVNRDISVLSAVFNLAKNFGEIKENPVKNRIKYYSNLNTRTRILSEEEEIVFFNYIKNDIKFSRQVEILLYTGMRRGELFKLEWRDIDFVNNCINLRRETTKTQKARPIPMFFNVREIFESLRDETKNFEPKDKIFAGVASQLTAFSSRFKEVADNLGFQDLTVHSLRHTFSTRANKYNVDAFAQKALLGHSKISMTDRYTHVSLDTLKNSLVNFENSVKNKKDNSLNSYNKKRTAKILEFKESH